MHPLNFLNQSNLQDLQLGNNQLTILNATDFAIIRLLRVLNVGENGIMRIERELFTMLPQLVQIDLSGNICADRMFHLGPADRYPEQQRYILVSRGSFRLLLQQEATCF